MVGIIVSQVLQHPSTATVVGGGRRAAAEEVNVGVVWFVLSVYVWVCVLG